jgi:tRNA (guanine6-N2)-methyltransferase
MFIKGRAVGRSGQERGGAGSGSAPAGVRNLTTGLSGEDGGPGTALFFTTNPGLEDVAAEEFHRRTLAAGLGGSVCELTPFGLGGHLLVRNPQSFESLASIVGEMRSIHHVLRPVHCFSLPQENPLEIIYHQLRDLEIPPLRTAASFRVTTKRCGRHPFTSIEVQKTAGTALVERYGRRVDLERYELNVRVDVFAQICLVSLQLTGRALSKRRERPYQPRTALKVPVAYAMLQFARLEPGEGALLDPFCGSGTILVEAARLFPRLELHGCDLFPEAVDGARRNLEALGLSHRIQVRQADARALGQVFPPDHFRAIVTNPPFGVKVGRKLDFARFYPAFLEAACKVLAPGGFLVLLAWKRGLFSRAVRQVGKLRLCHMRVVEIGDLYPRLFVLEKPGKPR